MSRVRIALPFTMDRVADTPLSVQVARGLRGAIRNGFYRPGQRLPGVRAIARSLGTSNVVVTAAVRELVQEGLIAARPRSGIRVLGDDERTWRGHVLWLGGTLQSYYFAAREEVVAKGLEKANLRLTAITCLLSELEAGQAMLRTCLQTMGITLVVNTVKQPGVEDICGRFGVPLVSCTGEPCRAAAGRLVSDMGPAVEAMAEHVAGLGVTGVAVLRARGAPGVGAALAARGVPVTEAQTVWQGGVSPIEDIERAGYATTRRMIAERRLPQLLYITDDYMARGCVSALLEAGRRIPDDVQVIAHTNRGNLPVLGRELTRIETDPHAEGRAILELIEHVCSAALPVPCIRKVESAFVVGQTTRPLVY